MQHELPARPDLEHYRKQAKALVRAYYAGERDVVDRVEAVLGRRAESRFHLTDAQYVLAAEHGHASWVAFKRSFEPVGIDALFGVERGELVLDSGLRYTEGEPVEVRVRKRLHRYSLDDDGAAVRLAGRPPGWLDVAQQVVAEFWLNINRRGVVCVGSVYPRKLDWLASRVAETSLAVYEALLELDES